MGRKTSPASGSRAARFRALLDLCAAQEGYFTAAQAAEVGWSRRALAYHVRTGLLARVARGLYRLADLPEPPFGDVVAAWLLVGPEHAVVSHHTALEVLGLAETRSGKVHLTVPRERRPRRPLALPWVAVHTASRPPGEGEVVRVGPLPVTSPARAIVDVAEMGDAGAVWHAIAAALRTGAATVEEILKAVRNRKPQARLLVEKFLWGLITSPQGAA